MCVCVSLLALRTSLASVIVVTPCRRTCRDAHGKVVGYEDARGIVRDARGAAIGRVSGGGAVVPLATGSALSDLTTGKSHHGESSALTAALSPGLTVHATSVAVLSPDGAMCGVRHNSHPRHDAARPSAQSRDSSQSPELSPNRAPHRNSADVAAASGGDGVLVTPLDGSEAGVGLATGALLDATTGALVASTVLSVCEGLAVLAPDGTLVGDVGADGRVRGDAGARSCTCSALLRCLIGLLICLSFDCLAEVTAIDKGQLAHVLLSLRALLDGSCSEPCSARAYGNFSGELFDSTCRQCDRRRQRRRPCRHSSQHLRHPRHGHGSSANSTRIT